MSRNSGKYNRCAPSGDVEHEDRPLSHIKREPKEIALKLRPRETVLEKRSNVRNIKKSATTVLHYTKQYPVNLNPEYPFSTMLLVTENLSIISAASENVYYQCS